MQDLAPTPRQWRQDSMSKSVEMMFMPGHSRRQKPRTPSVLRRRRRAPAVHTHAVALATMFNSTSSPCGNVLQAAHDEPLMQLFVASSLVEAASHVYAANLIDHFAGDDKISSWLAREWEPQKIQHGSMLRQFISRTWPSYDWEAAYEGFFREYTVGCTQAAPEPALSENSDTKNQRL